MKKTPALKRNPQADAEVVFCTECGATLDNFCFSEDAKSIKAVKANLARCKHSGKFDGEFCAKLFIAGDLGIPPAPPRTPAPRTRSKKK